MFVSNRLWLLPLAATLSCSSSQTKDSFQPPDQPVLYRRPDCPTTKVKKSPIRSIRSGGKLPTLAGGQAGGQLVVTHAGAGSSPERADGPQGAADLAFEKMSGNASALDAATEATAMMEDDPRFNAGTGSNIRLDGKTIQMDASLMTSEGRFAAVAAIERVKNPIRVVRLVLDSPHVFFAGVGATKFAHKLGIKDEVPVSKDAQEKYEKRMKRLKKLVGRRGSGMIDWRDYWNFPGEMPPDVKAWRKGGDTVGTVARDPDGRFAATLSTGGTSVTLYGRVGDVPVYAAGLFAGELGAVACTGKGEEIIRQGLARAVYERIAAGVSAKEAVEEAALDFLPEASVGIIAVDQVGWGVAANRSMAFGVAVEKDD